MINALTAMQGSAVSPCGLLQNELVQREIGDGMLQPLVLFSQLLQALHLHPAHSAIELASAIVYLLRDADLTNWICHRHSLSLQHLNPAKLRDNLLRLRSLSCHFPSPPEIGLILT